MNHLIKTGHVIKDNVVMASKIKDSIYYNAPIPIRRESTFVGTFRSSTKVCLYFCEAFGL